MWSKGIVEWIEDCTAFISVVFTWDLPNAYQRCVWLKQQGYKVKAGGVAVSLMPNYLKGVAEIGEKMQSLYRHNPDATRTSLGCIRACSFCAVRIIEPIFMELPTWESKPIVCDNNLTACSRKHFDKVIDSLKSVQGVDFNQGLDIRLLTTHHLDRLKELNIHKLRFAWDDIKSTEIVMHGLEKVLKARFPKSKIGVYVLFNYKDTPDDALYRCETLKAMGILPNVQRYQPLTCLKKNSYISPNWNHRFLSDFTRYWSRQIWFRSIPFSEYKR